MKIKFYLFLLLVGVIFLSSCNKHETYADQKKKERAAINNFIHKEGINVISEATFKDAQHNEMTDVSKNEYVFLENSGVYMQIIRKGCGSKLKDGERARVLCRFVEKNLLTDTVQLTNNILLYSSIVDKMQVSNTSGTFSGAFIPGSSLMYQVYGEGKTAVPIGWLAPLGYINLGRPEKEGDEIAKVKIIVPHDQGHLDASRRVYPCLYEITYERGV